MSGEIPNLQEFCEANSRSLQAIIDKAETLVANPNALCAEVTYRGEQIEPGSRILQDEITPQQVQERSRENDGLELDLETCEELASIENRQRIAEANLAVITLRTRILMAAALAAEQQGEPMPEFTAESVPSMLPSFSQAIFWRDYYSAPSGLSDYKISMTNLYGLEGANTAVAVQVERDTEGLREILSILKIGRRIETVFINYTLPDPLQEELFQLFRGSPTGFPQLIEVLMRSQYKDEAELDAMFAELRGHHIGKSTEQEAGPQLEQLRLRVAAAKQARVLQSMHGTNIPSVMKIRELGAHLGALIED